MAYKSKWIKAVISTDEITKGQMYKAVGRAPKFKYIIQCNDKGNKSFIPMKYFKKINLLEKIKLWLNSKQVFSLNTKAK